MPVEGAVSSMTPGPEPHSLRLAEAINFDPNGPGMGLDLDFNNLNFDLGNIDSDVVNTNRDITNFNNLNTFNFDSDNFQGGTSIRMRDRTSVS